MNDHTPFAVMSRRIEPADSLDFFPTPPWATRALCEWLRERGELTQASLVWEPACGAGDMARPLSEYFAEVVASDVADYGYGVVHDFLRPSLNVLADWIITNPPFKNGEQFATIARGLATSGVALLVRTAFLESADRFKKIFSPAPPSDILQFVERVPMFKGRLDRNGSTATAYCWLVWRNGVPQATSFHWIAPCRKRLERDSDYPEVAA